MRGAFVYEAELKLDEGSDPSAVGAAVTTGLCGHWEHEGPCRWPHNNEIRRSGDAFTFRTLFVAAADDEPEVHARIAAALHGSEGWAVRAARARPVAPSEETLAERLARAPTSR
jgi:hypothetical protein